MKCLKGKTGIFVCLCTMLIVAGCENENTREEDSAILQQGTVVSEEDVDEKSEEETGNYKYCILEDNSVKILKYTGDQEVIFVPEKLEGKTVSVIGEAAFQNTSRSRQVILPTGIVAIEAKAFEWCAKLEYIFLGENVREIGYRAFGNCASLKEIIFSEGMTYLGESICEDCTDLEKVVLPKSMCSIDKSAFSGCIEWKLIYGESEFAEEYAKEQGKVYVDFGRITKEGNQVW